LRCVKSGKVWVVDGDVEGESAVLMVIFTATAYGYMQVIKRGVRSIIVWITNKAPFLNLVVSFCLMQVLS